MKKKERSKSLELSSRRKKLSKGSFKAAESEEGKINFCHESAQTFLTNQAENLFYIPEVQNVEIQDV